MEKAPDQAIEKANHSSANRAPDEVWALRPRWVALRDGTWGEQLTITIRGSQIVALGREPAAPLCRVVDLPDAVVLPGLINAHTHLEFGGRSEPIPAPDRSFAGWILALVEQRRAALRELSEEERERRRRVDTALAVDQLTASGVTTIGEIARPGWPESTVDGPCATVVFLELLGLDETRIDGLLAEARAHLARPQIGDRWHAGLSPHAPYTVHPRLLESACGLSRETGCPIAMHLAESWDELELLASHSGPLVETLRELDAWNPASLPRGLRPIDYLKTLATAVRSLVVHGNFLDEPEWRFLAECRDRMSVVYCPRTHDAFLSSRYPLLQMLDRGVRVTLGTDSRATNPDLDFLAELRWVAARFPELAPARLLELATVDAAEALGRIGEGRIEGGQTANLTIVGGERANREPWFWLHEPPEKVRIVVQGRMSNGWEAAG